MTISEAMEARHSVRTYLNQPIEPSVRKQLDTFAETSSKEGNLHIFIRYDDPAGFDSRLAHYGKFENVSNYIVLAGKKDDDFDLRSGYYGEKLVLYAQQLGLNTCWTALTFNKSAVRKMLAKDESLCMVIALGYGKTQGIPHKGKTCADVTDIQNAPDWYIKGVQAALLAPTAMNQQKFMFSLTNDQASVRAKGIGPYRMVDLGIVKYHFIAASDHPLTVIY